MKIDRIDHFVLTVRDVEATCAFYSRVLGMEVVRFGEGRTRFSDRRVDGYVTMFSIDDRACIGARVSFIDYANNWISAQSGYEAMSSFADVLI